MLIPTDNCSLGGLISGDAYLTDVTINNLWHWFNAVIKDGTDSQLVFVKMVDSVRKPYVDHLATIDPWSLTPITSTSEPIRSWRRTSANPSAYAPSESGQTVTELEDLPSHGSDLSDTTQSHEGVMQKGLSKIKHQNAQLEEMVIPPTPMITRVAIKSVHFSNRYVKLDGTGVTSFQNSGGGQVGVQTFLSAWETFELVQHTGEPNIVSFKSTTFNNVFLRADAAGLLEGSRPMWGGGSINCQFGCGMLEKFRLRRAGDQGELAIESVAFPGRYVRLDGNYLKGIGLQGVINAWEKFYLVVVPG